MALRFESAHGRFADVQALFGPNGAMSGCWCMWNRQTTAEYDRDKYEANQQALEDHIADGTELGLVAYNGDKPVGWVALAPRAEYSRLARSPVTKPIDDVEVWSVTCFVVAKSHRGQGVARALLAAAVSHARDLGAKVLEGYPLSSDGSAAGEAWHGLESMFQAEGFTQVARRKPRRPIYRMSL